MSEAQEMAVLTIISNVGMAKSIYIRAIGTARQGKIEEARAAMEEGRNYYLEGHRAHAEQLSLDAGNEEAQVNLLLVHAEDQLSSAEMAENMAAERIALYELLYGRQILKGED